jgi:glycosyltransferase involved in cell wall biosynthesis
LISFHFPPGGAAGALRWQKLSHFAQERGWALDAIALHPSGLEDIDDARLADLPAGTRVYGVPVPKLRLDRIDARIWQWYRALRPAKPVVADAPPGSSAQAHALEYPAVMSPSSFQNRVLRRFKQFFGVVYRGYFAWMDYHTHGAWADEVTKLGLRLSESEEYEAIVTCGPPHMAHEAGRRLAERTGLPLIVDLRDPWRLVQRLAVESALWYRLAAFYERRVVEKASLIVMNTTPARDAMRALYPSKRNRVIAVMNGYDEEAPRSAQIDRQFMVAYAGSVSLDRDPRLLLNAMARVVSALDLTPEDIGMEFMGDVQSYQNASVQSLADAAGIGDYVRILGPGPRRAALEFLSRASVLVSLPQDSDMAIPSKVFEYMQFNAWVLAIAQRGSATELLLRGSEASVVAPDDVEGMTNALMSWFRRHQRGAKPVPLSATMPFASRRIQAGLLFDAIDEVVRLPAIGSGSEAV